MRAQRAAQLATHAAVLALCGLQGRQGMAQEVLAPENVATLCRDATPAELAQAGLSAGSRVVDIGRLADDIVAAARVRAWMLEAVAAPVPAPEGPHDRAIVALQAAVAERAPIFGSPTVPGWTTEQVEAERLRAEHELNREASALFGLLDPPDDGFARTFRLAPDGTSVPELFAPKGGMAAAYIECLAAGVAPRPMIELASSTRDALAGFTSRFRLRASRDDLTSELDSADVALFSYLKNDNTDSASLSASGHVGVVLSDPDSRQREGITDAIAFVGFDRIENDDADEVDTDVLTPGGLLRYDLAPIDVGTVRLRGFGVGSAYLVADRAQDSDQIKGNLAFTPIVGVGGVLLSTWHTVGPGLELQPVLSFEVDGGHVVDRGTSAELAEASDYLGLGVNVGVRAELVPFDADFTVFVASLTWTYRNYSVGDFDDREVGRLIAKIGYQFPGIENVELNFSYENGENLETYVDEEFYRISLGLKF